MFYDFLQPTYCDLRLFLNSFMDQSPAYADICLLGNNVAIKEFPPERYNEILGLLKREGLLRIGS